MQDSLSIFIGYDPREIECYIVCRQSIQRRLTGPVPIYGLKMDDLQRRGLYQRQTERRNGQLWDVVSDAPMSTEFACSRFLAPILAGSGLAVFMDCDIMARESLMRLFALADKSKAVQCVQHAYEPETDKKMDGQIQTRYWRKNWSSLMLFNCDHPANKRLTVEMINTTPGRDLHALCWLNDDEIGALPERWNYLVGHSKLPPGDTPALVHWTEGAPCLEGYENTEFADEFRAELNAWATGRAWTADAAA